jgi:hypothetical protein
MAGFQVDFFLQFFGPSFQKTKSLEKAGYYKTLASYCDTQEGPGVVSG